MRPHEMRQRARLNSATVATKRWQNHSSQMSSCIDGIAPVAGRVPPRRRLITTPPGTLWSNMFSIWVLVQGIKNATGCWELSANRLVSLIILIPRIIPVLFISHCFHFTSHTNTPLHYNSYTNQHFYLTSYTNTHLYIATVLYWRVPFALPVRWVWRYAEG
jgi:hypothetical protein